MNNKTKHRLLTYIISAIWLINGLFCKVLGLVPRHEQIVKRILGDEYSQEISIMIGISEILMAFWVLSGIKSKLNAVIQIILISSMNVLEFFIVPDLLLWGKFNIVFAVFLILIIFYNEYTLNKKIIIHK